MREISGTRSMVRLLSYIVDGLLAVARAYTAPDSPACAVVEFVVEGNRQTLGPDCTARTCGSSLAALVL